MASANVQEILQSFRAMPPRDRTAKREWEGTLNPEQLRDHHVKERNVYADALYRGDWNKVMEILVKEQGDIVLADWVNLPRLNKPKAERDPNKQPTGYRALHQAAYHNAPLEIVDALVQMGGYCTCRTTDGQRPIDIARSKGYNHLLRILQPVILHRNISEGDLDKIQAHLYTAIREVAGDLIEKNEMDLPQLSVLLELENPHIWFPIPGMYGGFNINLENDYIIAQSFCRVVGGSGETRKITPEGITIIDSGWG